jgi:hypothetical protein
MKIRAIYKAGKEFKEEHLKLKHAFEDWEHFKNLNISDEEKKREIEEYNKSKQIYLLEDLYIAVLDEDSPDLKYQKDDLLLFSNSVTIEKKCLVVCQFNGEFLLAYYLEDEENENIYNVKPISEKYPKLTNENKDDLKIFGMVLKLHRLSDDWKEKFMKSIES